MSLLEDLLQKNPSLTLNSQYTNIRKFANGSFSDVFFAENLTKTSTVILKAPHKTSKSYAEISREAILLIKLKDSNFVPKVLYLQADAVCEVMVLEKLGVSLEVLKQEYNNFSLKTTILLACQLLNILEKIHELGVLHRDIKPSNILIGEGLNKNKVYLIDFDIAQTFSQSSKDSKEAKEMIFGNQFVGTKAFASRNAHKCGTFSRKDDLESLFFTILYLLEGKLPWISLNCDLRAMGTIKDQFLKGRMLEDLPKEFAQFFEYLEKMKCETVPDYAFLKNLFVSMAKRFSLNLEDNECEWTENEISFEKELNEMDKFLKEKSKENYNQNLENCQNYKEDDEIVTESDEGSIEKKIFELKSLAGEKKKGFMMKNNKKSSFMTGFKEIFLKQQIQ